MEEYIIPQQKKLIMVLRNNYSVLKNKIEIYKKKKKVYENFFIKLLKI